LPFSYALAEAYTLCDAYHCSVLGPTYPNRLEWMTGMIDPDSTGGGPVTDNNVPMSGFTWTTYPELLQAAGVSWKVYQQGPDYYNLNALRWFSQYEDALQGNPLYDRGMVLVGNLISAFQSDVRNGTLPRVSWIIPPWSESEHPSFSPADGEILTKQLLDALASNPAVYNSTVFILTYDEGGGFFDHVPPPVPPPSTPDEFVQGLPIGLGARVPTILISPWTRGGYVCSQVFDHTSAIRFLESWTGVYEPNISAWRRQVCGDLTSAFDFANPDTNYPSLPTTAEISCPFGFLPTEPSPQTVPTQETGIRPGRPLPYQPNATSATDCGAGQFWITMTNDGAQSAHFAIYPNAYRTDGPWQYDVAASGSLSANFSVVSSNGRYDLTCYGPNGFQRRSAGNINSNCNQVDVISTIDPDAGDIMLAMQNLTATTVVFTVTNGYATDGPRTYSVPPATTVTDTFPDVANNYGWYDMTATASSDPQFLRRFAGHVETDGKDFLFTVTSATQTVATVNDAAFTVTVAAINGFTGEVNLSVTGLPTNVSASFSPATVTDSGTSAMSLTSSTNTVTGTYLLTVMGTSSNATHVAVVTLTVNPPDFTVAVTPNTQLVVAGSNTTYTVAVGAINGFTGDVNLSVTGLPACASADLDPACATGSGTSTLSVATSTNTPLGSYPLTVTGTSGNATHTAAVTLMVRGPDLYTWWAQQYFGCTNCPQALPDSDPLGKGISNTNQFLLGLNPTNPASLFQIISMVQNTTDVVIVWKTAGVHTNAVQATSGDTSGGYNTNGFADISSPVIIGVSGDTTTNYTDAGGATNAPSRFYRVRLVP